MGARLLKKSGDIQKASNILSYFTLTYEGFVIWPDPKHAGDIALKADIKLGGFKKTPARHAEHVASYLVGAEFYRLLTKSSKCLTAVGLAPGRGHDVAAAEVPREGHPRDRDKFHDIERKMLSDKGGDWIWMMLDSEPEVSAMKPGKAQGQNEVLSHPRRRHVHQELEVWAWDSQAVRLFSQVLNQRAWSATWLLCILVHYICMVIRWCSCWKTNNVIVPLLQHHPVELPSSGAMSIQRGVAMPPIEVMSDKDFWPPAPGLSQLLLGASCERAPLALPFFSVPSPATRPQAAQQRQRPPRLEDFDTIGLIGYGEFGKVYQVRDRVSQQTFAVKRLSKEFYGRKQMADKARREISTLNLAQEHPFIVRLIHALENPNEWAMIMEYCPGGDLQQVLLTEGCPGLPLQRILKISAEVTLALEHLHCRGIVFRDLKLENVVLAKDGSAKLTDFGLAKQYRGGRDAIAEAQSYGGAYANFTKTFCGSYGYAAPEVNPRRQMHGFAADLYAFGILLVMMLTGGEVYHDSREAPFERRLPPESLTDLRFMLGRLSYDFYWASHHLLQPARTAHRVELDLHGSVVITARGRRRGARPKRPPNSLERGDEGPRPRFPESAFMPCEEERRRWNLALELVWTLTDEAPERRGTVATMKGHAFFEEIEDWRFVYPQSWLAQQVKANLSAGGELPQRLARELEKLPLQVLVSLLDNQDEAAQLLEGLEQAEHLASSPAPSGSPVMRAASDPLAFTPHVSSSGSGQRASPIPEFQLQELSSEWP
ncbi:unnamed protein product [Effrenium voratum]|uniref:non-specific serine/threonine protein kinase n=1 Tax=Effrenium voratum TaxID=2562239 RepID=A0AA36J321_9DINO|nr:unnamed protein product [Effrenium voratum]